MKETETASNRYELDIIAGMAERTIRRLWVVILVLITVIVMMVGGVILLVSQYDFVVEDIEQDGGGINLIGIDGSEVVNSGAEVSAGYGDALKEQQ